MASRSVRSLRIAWEMVRQTAGTPCIHVVSGEMGEEYWRDGVPARRADHLRPAGPLLMVGFRAYGDELHICISRDTPAPARGRAILPLGLLKLAGVLRMADRQAPPGTPAQACALLGGDGRAVCVEQRPRPGICPAARDGRRRHAG